MQDWIIPEDSLLKITLIFVSAKNVFVKRRLDTQFDPLKFWIFFIFTNFLILSAFSCFARCNETHILSSRYPIPFFLSQIKLQLNYWMLQKMFDQDVNRFSKYSFDCKTFFYFSATQSFLLHIDWTSSKNIQSDARY